MGWDVLVFRLKDPSTRAMDMDESKVLPLGEPAVLRQAIGAVLPGVDWSDPTWGQVRAMRHSKRHWPRGSNASRVVTTTTRGRSEGAVSLVMEIEGKPPSFWSRNLRGAISYRDDRKHQGTQGFHGRRNSVCGTPVA